MAYFFWCNVSKGNGWVSIDKELIKSLPKDGRPYTLLEAMFSYTCDIDEGNKWTIKGYSKLWGWSRCKVRNFINSIRHPTGHSVDTLKTHLRHTVHFIDNGLRVAKDTHKTPFRHSVDTLPTTTIKTKTKTKEKDLSDKPDNIQVLFIYWQKIHNHKRAKLDLKRKKKITARLKDGYSVDDIKRAIDGCKLSPHHMGKNDNETIYDDIELICRDGSHVDMFIKKTENMKSEWDHANN